MTKVRVSAEARCDLERIAAEGIRDHGSLASARHIEGFRRLFQLLKERPCAGPEWRAPDLGVRTLSHSPDRVIYRIDGDMVIIDRILHQARDIGRALRSDH